MNNQNERDNWEGPLRKLFEVLWEWVPTIKAINDIAEGLRGEIRSAFEQAESDDDEDA